MLAQKDPCSYAVFCLRDEMFFMCSLRKSGADVKRRWDCDRAGLRSVLLGTIQQIVIITSRNGLAA